MYAKSFELFDGRWPTTRGKMYLGAQLMRTWAAREVLRATCSVNARHRDETWQLKLCSLSDMKTYDVRVVNGARPAGVGAWKVVQVEQGLGAWIVVQVRQQVIVGT